MLRIGLLKVFLPRMIVLHLTFSQCHWPAEGFQATGCADVAVAELQGHVWEILAGRWNRSRIFHLLTRFWQLGGRGWNYWYGQGPCTKQPGRVAGQRNNLSRAITLPFPHLFCTGRHRGREMQTTDESCDRKHETARDVDDTQSLTFLHNWAYHAMGNT